MEAELQTLFYDPVMEFATANDLGVAWPNSNNSKVKESPHLEISFDPIKPMVFGICNGSSRYDWLVLFTINVRDGVGGISPSRYADKLREAFPVLYKFSGIAQTYQIIEPANVRPGVSKPGWFFVPVQFRIRSIK